MINEDRAAMVFIFRRFLASSVGKTARDRGDILINADTITGM